MAVTTVVAYITVETHALQVVLKQAPFVIWIIFIGQLFLVGALSIRIFQLSFGAAMGVFLVYAALNGFTLTPRLIRMDKAVFDAERSRSARSLTTSHRAY
jgi:FtsH-binding integral membrane protein